MKRTFKVRREIIATLIAETATKPLDEFNLTQSELIFYRSRASQAIDKTASKASAFKAFYKLPTSKPFRWIIFLAALVVFASISIIGFLAVTGRWDREAYALIGTCWTVTAASLGWCVASRISHRNTVRQNTQNLIFSRFAQTAHTDALHNFHRTFGYSLDEKITATDIDRARDGSDVSRKGVEAVNYLLNYFEFISSGVLCGDLNEDIITKNIRGIIIYYYDKCEPYIFTSNSKNPKAFSSLIKIRTSYRLP